MSLELSTDGRAALLSEPRAGSHATAGRRALRSCVAVVALAACLWGMWGAGRAGLSRFLSRSLAEENQSASAERAVRLGPSDPEAHAARASVLLNAGDLAGAIRDYERAVELRPRDYLLWTSLAVARGYNGDAEGALAAHREAVRLAPYYAHPYWYMGAYLLELGRQDEAFAALSRAVESRPSLLTDVMSLAWDSYGGDARAVRQAVRPQTNAARLSLAKFFVAQGSAGEAIELFREAAAGLSAEERKGLLNELLNARQFAEAYEVWSAGRETPEGESAGENVGGRARFTDGGFEARISSNDPGFGWQPARNAPGVRISLDAKGARTGARSLHLEFSGDPGDVELISQLLLVEPRTRYRLIFEARTEEVITGGQPLITVADASRAEAHRLAQSVPLPQGASAWQSYALEFATADETRAVRIAVRRQTCQGPRCPIFGHVWLDGFSLHGAGRNTAQDNRKLSTQNK
jgi:Flp pilus assembly protein TadD